MKKSGIFVLLMLTVLFVGFICGFFLGRNWDHSDVQISVWDPVSTVSVPAVSNVEPQPATKPATAPAGNETVPPATEFSGKVNINTADKDALMTLPGIGTVLAQRILDYRSANGPFTSLSDLLMVEGIGEKRLDAIWEYITLGG